MLTAAIAAGITLAIGTPLGGVIFGIEVSTSIYLVKNLWKSFYASVLCVFISKLLRSSHGVTYEDFNENQNISFGKEIFLFVLLGLIGGIVGAMFSTFIARINYIRKNTKITWLNNRFKYAFLISLFVSHVTFLIPLLSTSDTNLLNLLFTSEKSKKSYKGLVHPIGNFYLLISFIFKFLLSMICLTVNMPAGLIGPFLTTGALIGRLYGQTINTLFSVSESKIYSFVGAACVLSGATHSISPALMILEMTGQVSYLAPLLLATLVANLTSQALAMSIFDVILSMKNLPNLDNLKTTSVYGLSAEQVMTKNFYSIKMADFTIINGMEVLYKIPKKYSYSIAILNERDHIDYTLFARSLYRYIFAKYNEVKNNYNIANQSHFDEILRSFERKLWGKHLSFTQYIIDKFRKIYYKISGDGGKLKLNKNFEEDSIFRIITILKNSNI